MLPRRNCPRRGRAWCAAHPSFIGRQDRRHSLGMDRCDDPRLLPLSGTRRRDVVLGTQRNSSRARIKGCSQPRSSSCGAPVCSQASFPGPKP